MFSRIKKKRKKKEERRKKKKKKEKRATKWIRSEKHGIKIADFMSNCARTF